MNKQCQINHVINGNNVIGKFHALELPRPIGIVICSRWLQTVIHQHEMYKNSNSKCKFRKYQTENFAHENVFLLDCRDCVEMAQPQS